MQRFVKKLAHGPVVAEYYAEGISSWIAQAFWDDKTATVRFGADWYYAPLKDIQSCFKAAFSDLKKSWAEAKKMS